MKCTVYYWSINLITNRSPIADSPGYYPYHWSKIYCSWTNSINQPNQRRLLRYFRTHQGRKSSWLYSELYSKIENTNPVYLMKARKVPHALIPAADRCIDRLVQHGIFEREIFLSGVRLQFLFKKQTGLFVYAAITSWPSIIKSRRSIIRFQQSKIYSIRWKMVLTFAS